MVVGTRKPGHFCWINMLTPEPAAAMAFYSRLLGWTFDEMPNMGHLISVDGKNIGGLFDVETAPEGSKAHIGVMVKVENADAFADKVVSLGGKIKPPFDVGDNGRMVVCHDPTGAEFDAWESKLKHGTEVDSHALGAPSWFEALTTDRERATSFYCSLFGWESSISPGPPMYTNFTLNGNMVAGMFVLTPEMGQRESYWGTYMNVKDVDETARSAEVLGATICVPPRDIPNIGRFCGMISPQGVFFYVITYVPRNPEVSNS